MKGLLEQQSQAIWEERKQKQAWLSVLGIAGIALASVIPALYLDAISVGNASPKVISVQDWLRIGFAILSSSVILLLSLRRSKLSLQALRLLLFAVALPVYPMSWIAQNALLQSNASTPILGAGFRVAMIAFATACVGRTAIPVALCLASFVESAIFWSWAVPNTQPGADSHGAAALNIMFAIVAAIIIWMQHQNDRYTQQSVLREMQARAQAHVARILLTLRDRANSPLQSLEIGLALLERDPSKARELLPHLRPAFERLLSVHAKLRELRDESTDKSFQMMDDEELDRSLLPGRNG